MSPRDNIADAFTNLKRRKSLDELLHTGRLEADVMIWVPGAASHAQNGIYKKHRRGGEDVYRQFKPRTQDALTTVIRIPLPTGPATSLTRCPRPTALRDNLRKDEGQLPNNPHQQLMFLEKYPGFVSC